MSSEKELLRKRLKAERLAMSASDVETKSQQITQKLLNEVSWGAVKNVHIYKSVPQWNEVDTEPLISEIKRRWPAVTITLPSTGKNNALPSLVFNVIIVPVLGFDKNNYRLGLGAGWYDRFLAAQPQAHKIGLAFASALVGEGLPCEPHDIALNKIITEL